jgi:prepilin signal peptidase PulO-like enzyme (type II secretory pathway)
MPIILLASIAGAAVGLTLVLLFKRSRQQPMAFGPFLAAAAWFVMLLGQEAPGSLLIKDWAGF